VPSWNEALVAHQLILEDLRAALSLSFEPAVALLIGAFAARKKVLLCGNGGSWCDAAHFGAELTVRYKTDRRALAAICLIDTAALTACANDYGYERVFARQVEALGMPGDVLVAISTSGRSQNVNEAVLAAKFLGLGTLGLSGGEGITAGCDVDLVVPSKITARIQEAHALVIHMLCEEIDNRLPKGEDERWSSSR
jgi:D-sedoheptulose 7-phosphate isomerase